jgi:SOS response regulatory protein OraA/RecX
LLNKRVSQYKNIGLREMREKMFNFLVRHGFDFDITRAAIDEVLGREV